MSVSLKNLNANSTYIDVENGNIISREAAVNQLSITLKKMQEQIRNNEGGSDTERYETVLKMMSSLIIEMASKEEKLENNLGVFRKKATSGLQYYPGTDKIKKIIAEHVVKIKNRNKSRYSRHGLSRYVYRLHTAHTVDKKLKSIVKKHLPESLKNADISKIIHIKSAIDEGLGIMQTAELYKKTTSHFLQIIRLRDEIIDLYEPSKIISENNLDLTYENYQNAKQSALLKVEQMKASFKRVLFHDTRAAASPSFENINGEELLAELMGFHKNTYVYTGKIQCKTDGIWRTISKHFCVIPHNERGEITEKNIQEMKDLSTVMILHLHPGNFINHAKPMAQLFRTILDPKTDRESLPKIIRKFEYHLHHLSYFEEGNEGLLNEKANGLLLEAITNTICPEYRCMGYCEALTTVCFPRK